MKQAITEFKKQFKAKTAAAWEDRKTMVAKKGKLCFIMSRRGCTKLDSVQGNTLGWVGRSCMWLRLGSQFIYRA